MRNALTDSTVACTACSLASRKQHSLVLRPGEVRSVIPAAGQPGTYFYWAVLCNNRKKMTSGSSFPRVGMIPGVVARPDPDAEYLGKTVDSADHRNALAINGRSLPYTEPHATVGDTIAGD